MQLLVANQMESMNEPLYYKLVKRENCSMNNDVSACVDRLWSHFIISYITKP